MEVWGFQSQKQNLSGKKIKLLFRFMYFLKVKFCLWDFCNSQNQIYLLWQKKKSFVLWLKKKSCHKNLILGKHILCLHKVATMGPASIIPVICAFPCFSNNSVRGHAIDPNRYFTLSFGIRKLKWLLNLMQRRQLSFACDSIQNPEKCALFVQSLNHLHLVGLFLAFLFLQSWPVLFFGVCNVDHFFKPLLNVL